MPDEENDKIIREAADHYHPEYDDKAWEKMKQLLDVHLPRKKKKRKFIFFLLPLLLAGGMVLYFVAKNRENNSSPAKEVTVSSGKTKELPPPSGLVDISGTRIHDSLSGERKSGRQLPEGKGNIFQMIHPSTRKKSADFAHQNPIYSIEKNRNEINFKNNKVTSPDETIINQRNADDRNKTNPDVESQLPSSLSSNQKEILNQKENKQDIILQLPVVKEAESITKNEKDQSTVTKKKSKNSFAKNFGINISAGPDISGVQLDNPGKIAINFGLGFSYSLSPSFTLRTGFYAAKKIYSVGPNEYKATAGTGNYNYLENIDANCMVYSIPVNINYNFKKVKNHNWFVSTGLSSYLMKRETYEYYYKYPTGTTYEKEWTIHNQNQNFLSVLNLSGGYQYSFNKQMSIMAEPYLNLPLSGVGAGKVKLKSGGILFTLTVKPLLKEHK